MPSVGLRHSSQRYARVGLAVAFLLALSSAASAEWGNTSMLSRLAANAVGVFASVQPNEWNSISARIEEERALLDARERAVAERERALSDTGAGRTASYLFAALSGVLLILILLNYYADWKRSRVAQ